MADNECTWWPDGWPAWLGGQGDEWLHCCVAHDSGGTNYQLYECIVQLGWPTMAFIMFAGLSTLGVIYRRLRKSS